jgi:iron complex transport system ATP-binding protein
LTDTLLHINKLSITYAGKQTSVLEEVNLKVREGEVIVLLGENGVGKSSLLKTIAGYLAVTSGNINLLGKDIKEWNRKELALQLAFVPTHIPYASMLNIEEFVSFGRYPFTNWLGQLNEVDKKVVKAAIQDCGLEELKHAHMDAISDGERQKAAIARALAQEPRLLILDEPTTHLDAKNTTAVLRLLKEQSREKLKTILFSSHQVERALSIADTIWLFHEKSVRSVSPQEFEASKEMQEIIFGG